VGGRDLDIFENNYIILLQMCQQMGRNSAASFSAAFGRFSVALLKNCGRMGSGREACQLSRTPIAILGYKEYANTP
jgi:hypothetical protein